MPSGKPAAMTIVAAAMIVTATISSRIWVDGTANNAARIETHYGEDMHNNHIDIDALIEVIAFSITEFLHKQQTIRPHRWFAGEEIATEINLPASLGMTFNRAFARLPFDRIEIDDDMIRWREVR